MSIDLTVQYPGKVGTASPSWPFGEPRNITTPGDGTGTPWEAAIVKDTEAYKQSLLTAAGITPSGTPDTVAANQLMQALMEQAAGRAYRFDSSGTATAYVLTAKTDQYAPASLFAGLTVEFPVLGANSGAVTVNYAGLGAVALLDPDGNALITGAIIDANIIRATFDGANWRLHMNRNFNQDFILLDTPQQIAGGSTGASIPWTTVGHAVLTAAQATVAFVEMRARVTTSAGATTILKVCKGGIGPTFTTSIPANALVLTSPTVDVGSDNNFAAINLDAAHQIDYEVLITGGASTVSWSIYLMGWQRKFAERDY